jgi:peptidyl-prolyl cis-trans isomerase SurA
MLALAAGTASVCAPAAAQSEQSIVVLVNDDPITLYDIEQRQRFLAVTTQAQPSPALKKQATDMLIEERLQIQQAKKLGLTPDEATVNKVLLGMAKRNNMSPEGLAAALGQMGVNVKTLRDRVRAQVAWQEVVRRKFRHDVVIGDADVDKALSGGNGEAEEKTTLQLRQVKYQIPSNANQSVIAKQLAEMETVRAKLQSCGKVRSLTQGMKGLTVKTLNDRLPSSLSQPTRLLVMKAKVGQMTPPTLSGSAIEAYAVCGRHAVKGDPEKRQETESKLMEQELGIRAEGLLRDMRQEAFIEYR